MFNLASRQSHQFQQSHQTHRSTVQYVRHRLPGRAALVLVAAALALLAGLAPASLHAGGSAASAASAAGGSCALGPRLVPLCGQRVLTGAYVSPRSGETYSRAFDRFEQQTGAPTQIVHLYYRGARLFPSSDEQVALRQGGHRRILFAAWKPDDGYTWRQVADGKADAVLRQEADYLKANWRQKMFLTIHHEPENEVQERPGSGYRAEDYRAMFRHVEDVFDARGVSNVVWVMNYMGFERWAVSDWFPKLYPGRRYVDWLAYDPYKTAGLGGQDGGFGTLVNQYYGASDFRGFYRWARQHHPRRPVMLAEWGIGERSGAPQWKADLFRSISKQLDRYPALRALVYFDHDDADVAGNVSIDTSGASLDGFRAFVHSGVVASIG
jgi:hypothetical protein